MKTTNIFKRFSILGIILMVIGALLKTGGDGTSIIVVLISSLLFIAASIKVRTSKIGKR